MYTRETEFLNLFSWKFWVVVIVFLLVFYIGPPMFVSWILLLPLESGQMTITNWGGFSAILFSAWIGLLVWYDKKTKFQYLPKSL